MSSELSHRDLARLAALWLLDRRWAFLACHEFGLPDGVADAIAVSKPRDPAVEALVEVERLQLADQAEAAQLAYDAARAAWNVEAMAWDAAYRSVEAPHDVAEDAPPRPKHPAYPRVSWRFAWQGTPETAKGVVAVVEVKRTRADLLQDLRKRKLLKYEPVATTLYLAGTSEALGYKNVPGGFDRVLEDLADRGLPKTWGVLLLPTEGNPSRLDHGAVIALRGARRTRAAEPGELRLRAYQIGRSLSYRGLRGDL